MYAVGFSDVGSGSGDVGSTGGARRERGGRLSGVAVAVGAVVSQFVCAEERGVRRAPRMHVRGEVRFRGVPQVVGASGEAARDFADGIFVGGVERGGIGSSKARELSV